MATNSEVNWESPPSNHLLAGDYQIGKDAKSIIVPPSSSAPLASYHPTNFHPSAISVPNRAPPPIPEVQKNQLKQKKNTKLRQRKKLKN